MVGWQCCPCLASCCMLRVRWLWARVHPVSTMPGIEVWCRGAGNTVRQRRSAWQGPAAPGRPPYRSTMPAGNYLLRFCCASGPHLLVVRTSHCGKQGAPTGHPCYWTATSLFLCCTSSPHRLVVRTSRCGHDNPGSNPGVDTCPKLFCQGARCPCVVTIMVSMVTFGRVCTSTTGPSTCVHQNDKNDRPHGPEWACTHSHQCGNLKK